MSSAGGGTRFRRWLAEGVFGWEIVRVVAGAFSRAVNGSAATEDLVRSPRAADARKHSEAAFVRRTRWGTLFVSCASILMVASGVGFLFAYWVRAENWWMGISLAIFCASIGCTLVLWAHWLMREGRAIEKREAVASPSDRQAFSKTFQESTQQVSRRGMLKAVVALGVSFAVAIVVSLLRSLGMFPESKIFDTVWERGQHLVTIDGKLISTDSLQVESTTVVFPEGKIGDERAQTVLVRVDPEFLRMPDHRNDWAPMGYVAYSRVCTHAGCPVGMYQQNNCMLVCPCHQSSFDVLRAAQPTGGPAVRALPQLPLYIDNEGALRAGGGFTERPGPGFWSVQA